MQHNDDNSSPIYKETTQPVIRPANNAGKKRKDKSDLGENFVAPDGGWAWVVCLASGLSNFSVNPAIEQFGFIYRQRLQDLGMNTSQVTTIFNTCCAVAASTGILNGPLYRRFTFRQMGIAGSLVLFSGIMMSAFCTTFLSFLICYSIVFGVGLAVCVSASSMAINTYFKENRRKAAGFAWTIAGFGPIIFPAVANLLISSYGIQGTIFVFAAIGLHSLAGALIYQPVKYHVKPVAAATAEQIQLEAVLLCKYCEQMQNNAEVELSLEIEPNTPLSSLAKEDHFGSKKSLHSSDERRRKLSDVEAIGALETTEEISENRCTCSELRPLMQQQADSIRKNAKDVDVDNDDKSAAATGCLQKVVAFFGLDLLRDFTFVNIVLGLAVIHFGEINFAILSPFILHDFGLTTTQVTVAITVYALMDIIMRFMVPFITANVHWDNRVLFLIGVFGLVVGRTILAFTRSYAIILCTFAFIGLSKGIRTIFWYLIIPDYVPLKRLPAAMGLVMLVLGLFTVTAGPFVGLIRDKWNYNVTLHWLNAITVLAAFFWGLEVVVRRLMRAKTAS